MKWRHYTFEGWRYVEVMYDLDEMRGMVVEMRIPEGAGNSDEEIRDHLLRGIDQQRESRRKKSAKQIEAAKAEWMDV
jgi:hypothetical protein